MIASSLPELPKNRLRSACYNRRMIEQTLAIIKPDAMERRLAGRIIQRIEAAGFQIRAIRRVHMTRGQAGGFYAVHRDRPFFESLTAFMSSGPVLVMVLEAEDAIQKWRMLMGATDPAKADEGTLRREFAQSIERNATHGSDAADTAAFEIGHFFARLDLA
jgi:nucleoside-diphosphate kinase